MPETRKQRMESDFNPGYLPESMPASDIRLVHAAEYSAYQWGRSIETSLGSLRFLRKVDLGQPEI